MVRQKPGDDRLGVNILHQAPCQITILLINVADKSFAERLYALKIEFLGFFNIVGAMNGQPQLEMDMEKDAEVQYITSRFLPTDDNRDSQDAAINYKRDAQTTTNRVLRLDRPAPPIVHADWEAMRPSLELAQSTCGWD